MRRAKSCNTKRNTFFLFSEVLICTMNSDMMVLPRKGAKSPILYIFGASIGVNRRDEQTYCLALLQTYNFNFETSQV